MARSHLYLWDDRFLWLGESFSANFTGRYALTLVVSLAEKPMRITMEDGETLRTYALLTGPKVRRQLDARDTPFLSLNWDPHSPEFFQLSQVLQDAKAMNFDRETINPYVSMFRSCLSRPLSCKVLWDQCRALAGSVCGRSIESAGWDERVSRVAVQLKQELPSTLKATELAASVGLSTDRLTHLFSAQMGMSMRNFLLWAKARRAVSMILGGNTLTAVAHECGFSDSAHFTRTLREFYDVTPSMLADVGAVTLHRCG